MEMVACACGCGEMHPRYDNRGRERFYLRGHQNRQATEAQIQARLKNFGKRPTVVWNKGKTYIHASKGVYANKGAWNKALRRLYPDTCMVCGWDKASCDTHHITPRASGGDYSIGNGVILCPNCHRLADNGILTVDELLTAKNCVVMTGEIV